MNRALTGGVGVGSSLALGLRFLDSLDHSLPLVPPDPLLCLATTAHWWELHYPSLALGVLLGFFLLPLIEALLTVRYWIYRGALQGLVAAGPEVVRPSRPLFRIL